MEQKMIPAGHQMVNLRLKSHFSESHEVLERMGGISYLFFLRELSGAVEKNWPGVLSTLKEIHRILLNRKTMISNITVDQPGWTLFQPILSDFLRTLPESPGLRSDWPAGTPPVSEGLTIPSQINYVGKGANIYQTPYQFHGSALVITRYLRNGWLWDQVRVQGGAYGAFCMLDRLSGVLSLVSYRDPNLFKTVDTFDGTAGFLQKISLSREELTKNIIGAIGDMDSYMLPDAKGFASMVRYLMGHTEESRQQMREEILATTEKDFRAMAPALEEVRDKGIVKVLGSLRRH